MRPRHAHFPKDTRHFPIREWLRLGADFSARRIISCVLQKQRARILWGNSGVAGWNLQIWKHSRLYGGARSPEQTILSLCISLLTGNLTGKSRDFGSRFTHGAAWHAGQFIVLSLPWLTVGAEKNREFSRYIRELKIPVIGSSSDRLFLSCRKFPLVDLNLMRDAL